MNTFMIILRVFIFIQTKYKLKKKGNHCHLIITTLFNFFFSIGNSFHFLLGIIMFKTLTKLKRQNILWTISAVKRLRLLINKSESQENTRSVETSEVDR